MRPAAALALEQTRRSDGGRNCLRDVFRRVVIRPATRPDARLRLFRRRHALAIAYVAVTRTRCDLVRGCALRLFPLELSRASQRSVRACKVIPRAVSSAL